jgi:hypothetical protein
MCLRRLLQNRVGHRVRDLVYKPASLQRYEEELEAQRRAREVLEAHEKRMAYLAQLRRHRCATDIQRVWRGYRTRKPYKGLFGRSKDSEAQRLLDHAVRNTLSYKVGLAERSSLGLSRHLTLVSFPCQLKYIFGLAPILQTDPLTETVLKHYPIWLHNLVKEAVRGGWIEALVQAAERDEFVKTHPVSERYSKRLVHLVKSRQLRLKRSICFTQALTSANG